MKEILLNVESKEKRLAILKYGKLQDLIIERNKSQPLSGNIYRGKVTNILHNIQSAFIDIGEGENGFIHINDIIENTQKFQEMFDMDFDWDYDVNALDAEKVKETDISKLMKLDQPVLVQVVKESIGTKGARLTSNITIPGRYLVLLPNTPHRGVSRKIQDRTTRDRLKKIIRAFEMPKEMGLICRTASVNASMETLIEEAQELFQIWEEICNDFHEHNIPTCLYKESDLIKKALITAMDKKFDRMLIDDYKTYQYCRNLSQKFSDQHPLKIEMYRDKTPMFERFNVENEIEKALRRKIWLQSGGYLFFDRTEAMHTIDVNSGRSHRKEGTLDIEEALVQINKEAAEEIARQLRIRNIGGLVICDFIDMRSRKNQRRVLDCLKEAMKDDSAKCTILGMSEFGLVEMTRQRNRESLHQTLFTHCPYCNGRGHIKNHETITIELERAIRKAIKKLGQNKLTIHLHPDLYHYIHKLDQNHLFTIAEQEQSKLTFKTKDILHMNEYEIYALDSGTLLEL